MRYSPGDEPDPTAGPPRKTKILIAIFTLSGIGHLLTPRIYDSVIPWWVPKPRGVIFLSGVAELACAAGRATAACWAGPASAALLVGVSPAHIQMVIDDTRAGRSKIRRLVLWARIPMQLPMIKMALDAGAS